MRRAPASRSVALVGGDAFHAEGFDGAFVEVVRDNDGCGLTAIVEDRHLAGEARTGDDLPEDVPRLGDLHSVLYGLRAHRHSVTDGRHAHFSLLSRYGFLSYNSHRTSVMATPP